VAVVGFEELLRTWGDAACSEWGYPNVTDEWLAIALQRLPAGLGTAVAHGVTSEQVTIVEGHRFTLEGLESGKGPYAFFSRSSHGEPAPNWEYFVQVAEYLRLRAALSGRGLRVNFEDDLMDLAVYSDDGLLWCVEVKERARQLAPLVAGIRRYGQHVDFELSDRGNDPLRKAKYLVRRRPPYFSAVAIGCRLDFSVGYDGDGFELVEDLVPFA
jgi:hypothetical protein